MSLFDRCLLASILLLSSGCDRLLGEEDPPPPPQREAEPEPPPPDLGGAAPPEPLMRSERKLRFPGKSAEHMGFDLRKLSQLHALAGAVELPEWSDPGEGSPRMVRDDDLRTSWACQLGPDQACAIGIHFPEPAEVEMVRLFAGTPKADHTLPKVVRVHTDEGWAEARIPDEDGAWHVLLGERVTTRNLTVEWMDTHGDAPVHLAELEVYGRTGAPRPPLSFDPVRRVISFDDAVWRKKSRTHTAGPAFVEEIDVDGRLRRVLPGTAVLGQAGDRLLLVERADYSTCKDHQGAYQLLDTKTRVLVPLGDMGGFGSNVFRHAGGLGFGFGRIEGDDAEVQAVVLDGDKYELRAVGRLEQRAPKKLFADWNIAEAVLSRSDARPLDDLPPGCGPARLEDLDALRPTLPKRTKLVAKEWYGCSLGGETQLLMTTGGKCGKAWQVAVIDAEGTVVGTESGKESKTHLRVRRIDGETVLVELWGDKDSPRVMQADGGALTTVEDAAAMALRPPSGCRDRCDVDFAELVP